MVIFLAALHAVPVLLIAAFTKNRAAIMLSAIGMAGIGVATGAGRYMFIDTLAVAIAAYLSYKATAPTPPRQKTIKNIVSPVQPKQSLLRAYLRLFAIIAGAYLLLFGWLVFHDS